MTRLAARFVLMRHARVSYSLVTRAFRIDASRARLRLRAATVRERLVVTTAQPTSSQTNRGRLRLQPLEGFDERRPPAPQQRRAQPERRHVHDQQRIVERIFTAEDVFREDGG